MQAEPAYSHEHRSVPMALHSPATLLGPHWVRRSGCDEAPPALRLDREACLRRTIYARTAAGSLRQSRTGVLDTSLDGHRVRPQRRSEQTVAGVGRSGCSAPPYPPRPRGSRDSAKPSSLADATERRRGNLKQASHAMQISSWSCHRSAPPSSHPTTQFPPAARASTRSALRCRSIQTTTRNSAPNSSAITGAVASDRTPAALLLRRDTTAENCIRAIVVADCTS